MQSEQCYRQWSKCRKRGRGGGGSGAGGGRRWAWVGGDWVGWAVQSWALGVGGVWWWWLRPATGVVLRGSDEGEDCLGTEAGEPGAGEWDGRGALGLRGGGGSPRRLDAKPRPVLPSPKFLGFDPRNLPASGTVGRDGQGG